MFLIKYLVLFIFCTSGGLSKHLPGYMQICKRQQSSINDCVRESVEALRPRLADGLPELDVPGIEPFYVPMIVIDTAGLPMKAVGRDIKVSGASDFTLTSLNVDLNALTVRARVHFPKLELEGRYSVDLQYLTMQINLKSVAVNSDAELFLRAQLEERNGVQYMKYVEMQTHVDIKEYDIELQQLFSWVVALGQYGIDLFNAYKNLIMLAMKPYLEATMSKLFLERANKVVDGIPFNELLPL